MTYRNTALVACLTVVLCGLSQFAAGATLCVAKNPGPGCPYSSIGAAVAAASAGDVVQVSQGTYTEDVVVGKAISLVGANRNNTIIDATGLKNGIYVDGLDNGGLAGVSVSGFKVQNANFEGILVTNASGVTISGNYVLKNNVNLNINTAACPGIPPFETNEGFDCGEGIHLSGVDHSIVADNLVENNSGGILLSDDTGATHDNLIMGNTVRNNPFDCGITLAVITGTVIAGNTIQQETIGIAVKTNSMVEAHLNNFINPLIGVDNIDGGSVDATLNWWGCSRGPTAAGCADISGTNVLYLPFLTKPF